MNRFLNKVIHGDARRLLRALPSESIDAVIADAMYGTSMICRYDWGLDPAQGDPKRHWDYHQPLYQECLRVLRPGGVLAWGQGPKFCEHFRAWFGPHRLWTLTRFRRIGRSASAHLWVVQTKEQKPVEFPHRDSLIVHDSMGRLCKLHPCIKPVAELAFMVESLTSPGDIVLDCFCGLGSTLLAAEQFGRRWIGCDLSARYCEITLSRMAHLKQERRRLNSSPPPSCHMPLSAWESLAG